MKKLTKKSLDELAKTMSVIPEEERGNYWGMYSNDCFWRCVSYLATGNSSEASAASYAEQFWTDQLGSIYNALNQLSVTGGAMTPADISAFQAYNASNASNVNLDLSSIRLMNLGGNDLHAVIYMGLDTPITISDGKNKVEIAVYKYYDPQNGTIITGIVNHASL